MSSNLISILMPIYNGEKFLREAIESLLAQSYTEIEIIAVNDGSTDASLAILNEYEKKDTRVKVWSQENRGIVHTLNASVGYSSGSYLARMDADDISRPDRLEKQLAYLIKNDLDIVGGGINRFGVDLDIDKPKLYPETNAEIKASIWAFGASFAHPTILARRTVLEENLYQDGFQGVEDMNLWMRLSLKKIRMGNIPDVVLDYRRHDCQITKSKNKQWHTDYRIKSMNDALNESDISFHEEEVSIFYHAVHRDRRLTLREVKGFLSCVTKILSLPIFDQSIRRGFKRKILDSLLVRPSIAGVLAALRLYAR
jgi:glycosyltransferase involved in cell wall biosynthesis